MPSRDAGARVSRSARSQKPALAAALAIAGLSVASWLGCRGVQVPEPLEGTPPDDPREARCVDVPPPTVRLEELPPRPAGAGERAVWVDGAWVWRDGAWTWQPGEWAEPPPLAFYVRPKLVRLSSGALAWFPGHWHTREDEREARAFGRAPVPSGSIACPSASASASVSASASAAPSSSSSSSTPVVGDAQADP